MKEDDWYVFDPEPADGSDPVLIRGFRTKEAAEDYANEIHPEDGSGLAVVLQAIDP